MNTDIVGQALSDIKWQTIILMLTLIHSKNIRVHLLSQKSVIIQHEAYKHVFWNYPFFPKHR